MKFGQILMQRMTLLLTCFELHSEDWKLVTGPFMILIEWKYHELC